MSMEHNAMKLASKLNAKSTTSSIEDHTSVRACETSLGNENTRPSLIPSAIRRMHSMSYIDIALHNEDGEQDDVEIDVADNETTEVDSIKQENSLLVSARRKSISERLKNRRNSELAADIIRLSAENRRREFQELLSEHLKIVKAIENWKPTDIHEEEDKENFS